MSTTDAAPAPSPPPEPAPAAPWWRTRAAQITLAVVSGVLAIWGSSRRGSSVADVPLQVRTLPGFDIGLPSGELKDDGRDYAVGRLLIREIGGSDAVVNVKWEAGELLGDEIAEVFAKTIAAASGHPKVDRRTVEVSVPGGLPHRSWELVAGSKPCWVTQIGCGARRIFVTTTAANGGATLHQRVVGGFVCHPDPGREQALTEVPAVFDLDETWQRIPNTPSQLQLTDGKNVVMAEPLPSADTNTAFETLIEVPGVLPGIAVGKRDDDQWPIRMTLDGAARAGWMQLLPCPERNLTLLLVWLGAGDGLDAGGRATLRRARCRTRTEPLQAR
jgi:hypothetical protein